MNLILSKWVHHFDPDVKNRACCGSTLCSTPPKKFKRVPSAGKMMTSIFVIFRGYS
jgi:hypothetical protein